jgi:hypothetical protein
VRGTECDLGGVGGGFGVQSVDGVKVETNPLGLGLKMDYCLQKQTVDCQLNVGVKKRLVGGGLSQARCDCL